MKTLSLAVLTLIVVALAACSTSSLTQPRQDECFSGYNVASGRCLDDTTQHLLRPTARAHFDEVECRSGYNVASGRCSDDSTGTAGSRLAVPRNDTRFDVPCRSGYSVATGRCDE